jgi:hypothetical protein
VRSTSIRRAGKALIGGLVSVALLALSSSPAMASRCRDEGGIPHGSTLSVSPYWGYTTLKGDWCSSADGQVIMWKKGAKAWAGTTGLWSGIYTRGCTC